MAETFVQAIVEPLGNARLICLSGDSHFFGYEPFRFLGHFQLDKRVDDSMAPKDGRGGSMKASHLQGEGLMSCRPIPQGLAHCFEFVAQGEPATEDDKAAELALASKSGEKGHGAPLAESTEDDAAGI